MTHAAPTPSYRIVVAADSPLAAARIEALLRKDSRVEVVISGPGQLTTLAKERAASVVILALSAPTVARALERLAGAPRMPPVIVLTSTPHAAWTARARRRGVRAVLHRDATAEELAAAIAATTAGLLALHPDAVLGASTPVTTPSTDTPVSLTAREIEVLEMLAEGMSNRAIALGLKISGHTVKFHVAALLGKLRVRSRTEAVTAGIRLGLISL
jgi:DNA-binding NarL/FixJ family response regulator